MFEEDVGKIAPAERLMGIATMVYENRRKLLGTAGSWFILDVVWLHVWMQDEDGRHAHESKYRRN